MHARQADEIANMLARFGRVSKRDGSLMATVNLSVIALRAAFDDINQDVMKKIRSGEDYVISAFDVAISSGLDEASLSALKRMRGDLVTLINCHTLIYQSASLLFAEPTQRQSRPIRR